MTKQKMVEVSTPLTRYAVRYKKRYGYTGSIMLLIIAFIGLITGTNTGMAIAFLFGLTGGLWLYNHHQHHKNLK